jgi:hypothetical protein
LKLSAKPKFNLMSAPLTPQTIRKAAIAAGYSADIAGDVASFPGRVAATLANQKLRLTRALAEIAKLSGRRLGAATDALAADCLNAGVKAPASPSTSDADRRRAAAKMASDLMTAAAPAGLTRQELNQLPPVARLRFAQSGGRMVDKSDGKTLAAFMPPTLTRAAFNALTPSARLAHIKSGGRLSD